MTFLVCKKLICSNHFYFNKNPVERVHNFDIRRCMHRLYTNGFSITSHHVNHINHNNHSSDRNAIAGFRCLFPHQSLELNPRRGDACIALSARGCNILFITNRPFPNQDYWISRIKGNVFFLEVIFIGRWILLNNHTGA